MLEAVRNDKNAGVNQTYVHIAKSFLIKIKMEIKTRSRKCTQKYLTLVEESFTNI